MEISRKKFIATILVSAVCGVVLFVLGLMGLAYFFDKTSKNSESLSVLHKAPLIPETKPPEFRDTTLVYSSEFDRELAKNLIEGNGKISGKVYANKEPCSGLKIRLALNGSAWSAWGVSNDNGEYQISVPFGKYRVDGWEIDETSANKILVHKKHHPNRSLYNDIVFEVDKKQTGKGPHFFFVDPITILHPVGKISMDKANYLEWQTYPNAAYYRIQVNDHGTEWNTTGKTLYGDYSKQLYTKKKVLFSELGINIEKGHLYTVKVRALNSDFKTLSDTFTWIRDGFYISE